MKKLPKDSRVMSVDEKGYDGLLTGVSELLEQARHAAARSVNQILTATYWEIGKRIVEYEQGGKKRADYAEETLKSLSKKLTAEFGRGYSVDNLERMRRFYLMYRKSATQLRISSGEALPMARSQKSATVLRISTFHFPLSWSHYLFLKGVSGVKSLFLNLSTMNFAILDPKDVYGPDFPGETFLFSEVVGSMYWTFSLDWRWPATPQDDIRVAAVSQIPTQ